jgi:hypothetical protein
MVQVRIARGSLFLIGYPQDATDLDGHSLGRLG